MITYIYFIDNTAINNIRKIDITQISHLQNLQTHGQIPSTGLFSINGLHNILMSTFLGVSR